MKFIYTICLVVLTSCCSQLLQAQAPRQLNSSEIFQKLQQLNTLGTVLYVAAHPDDENTRLLSWLVGNQHFRTAYVSLTRGDGGQNLLGTELGTLLGAIRTQELLEARKVDGAEQYFTRAYDFGFSKNPEETLQKWNEDSLLQDLVVLIRKIHPDVMICRFPTNGLGGHGHHTASAILAQKAFDLAADKNFKVANGLPPWKVKRIFWNTYSFSSINTTSEDQLQLEVGTFNPILGVSYGEIASKSRSKHKSQGFGTAATRGATKEYFLQWGGDSVANNLFEGLNTTWSRIHGTEHIQKYLQQAIQQYEIENPAAIIPQLLEVKKAIQKLQMTKEWNPEKEVWLKYQLKKTDALILQCAGIWATATTDAEDLSPGDSTPVELEWIQRTNLPVQIEKVRLGDNSLSLDTIIGKNKLWVESSTLQIPSSAPYSSPYWLEKPIVNNLFQPVKDPNGNTAFIKNDSLVEIDFTIDKIPFKTYIPLNKRFVDPVKGEIYKPVVILPPVTLQWSSPISIHPNGKIQTLHLQITAHTDLQSGILQLNHPKNWKIEANEVYIPNLNKGESFQVEVQASCDSLSAHRDTLSASLKIGDKEYHEQLESIEYDHIEKQSIITDANIALISFPVKISSHKIGYIEGAGDWVAEALSLLGYEIVPIDANNYSTVNYVALDAIVTGIRAYNTHEWLNAAYSFLMKYVENGGNLVVQYNTNNRLGPIIAKMFPYDMEISRNRVTVEEAPVTFLHPEIELLHRPNTITDKDFESWIQERGIYFIDKHAEEWKPVLSMHDPGEEPLDGSLMIARYGKGELIYTGLSFFRELPAGVSGAFRLLVNLVEAGENAKSK